MAQRLVATLGTVLILSFTLFGCASENRTPGTAVQPGIVKEDSTAPITKNDDEKVINEGESHEGRPEVVIERKQNLPDTFPTQLFALPEHALIFDSGERSIGQWFLITQNETQESAIKELKEIADLNNLVLTESTEAQIWYLENDTISAEVIIFDDEKSATSNFEIALL